MQFARLYLLAAVVAAFLVVASTALAHPDGTNGAAGSTRVSEIPLTPADPTGWDQPSTADWPVVGGNYLQNRYSALNQVTTANVSQLKEAWHIHLNSGKGTQYRGEGNPIVYGGVMYMVNRQRRRVRDRCRHRRRRSGRIARAWRRTSRTSAVVGTPADWRSAIIASSSRSSTASSWRSTRRPAA